MSRVLILCEYSALNGAERSMLSTLGPIAAAGFQVRVAAPATGPLAASLRDEGIDVLPFEVHRPDGSRRPLDELRAKLADLIRSCRPEMVHANSLAMGRLSGSVVAELSLPSLAHLRDIISLSRQAVVDLSCHRSLLAVSAATRQFHVAQGLPADKVFVVHNGVDMRRFCPRPPTGYLHRELGLDSAVPLIGTIGQISLRKGQDILAAALAEIRPETPFCWLVVGHRLSAKEESRQFEEQLRRTAAGRLAGRVRFLGLRDDIDRILNELALLVHPARQEPLGRVLLEAAAAGLAVVAVDVGGTAEIFPPESDVACLVPAGDVPAMSTAVARLLADLAQRQRLGENARKRAEAAFDLTERVKEILGHYREIINA